MTWYLLKKPDGSIVYPYSMAQLRTDNPTTSFPESLDAIADDWNCYPVQPSNQPQYNPITHTLTEGEPKLMNGEYQQTWQLVAYPLEQVKLNKLTQINQEWHELEIAGWDCGQGHLGLSAEDVALLSGAFALAKEGAALGLPLPSIVTQENNQIDFATIQEMTQLMLMYGAARSQMSTEFAARRRQVAAAVTVAEVEGV